MIWLKKGIIWKPKKDHSIDWCQSHAMVPTPVIVNKSTIRIYFSCLDPQGVGRPGFIEVCSQNPSKVLTELQGPLLDVGIPGTFDDNGVLVTSVIKMDDFKWILYYVGFEICHKIRYRLFTGCAVSYNGGFSFNKVSQAPILDRTNDELFFRGGPFVLKKDNEYLMFYVSGSNWVNVNNKAMPVYNLKLIKSKCGTNWYGKPVTIMEIDPAKEHGFGRPWVDFHNGVYRLYFSVRNLKYGQYRLGYAESTDLIHWNRDDKRLGLDVSDNGFDSLAIMYSSVIRTDDSVFCFYNGNNFGEDGIGLAELISE